MYIATGPAYHDQPHALLVTDKRGQRLKPAQSDSDWLPIGELGSKALYQVYAERFVAVTPGK